MVKNKLLTIIAIMSIYFFFASVSFVSPAYENLAQMFPDTPYATVLLLGTIPSLLVIPTSLVAGALCGSKVSFRTMVLTSLAIIAVTGILPFFIQNFPFTLACRALWGIGFGMLLVIPNTLVMRLFDGQLQANLLGYGVVLSSIGVVIMSMVAGYLTSISTPLVWLVHVVAVIAFIICLVWLPEPEKSDDDTGGNKKKGRIRIPIFAWIMIACYAISVFALYPFYLGISSLIISEGIGDATSAGLVISINSLGGIIAGLIYGILFKITKRFALSISLAICAIGMVIIVFGGTIPLLIAGGLILGVGFFLINPAVFSNMGSVVPPAAMATASGFVAVSANILAFLSSYYMGFIGSIFTTDPIRSAFISSVIIFAALGFAFLFVKGKKQPAEQNSQDESA